MISKKVFSLVFLWLLYSLPLGYGKPAGEDTDGEDFYEVVSVFDSVLNAIHTLDHSAGTCSEIFSALTSESTPSCNHLFLFRLNDILEKPKLDLWTQIENHSSDMNRTFSVMMASERKPEVVRLKRAISRNCSDQCGDRSLNEIYESLIVKHLTLSKEFNSETNRVFTKIFNGSKIRAQLNPPQPAIVYDEILSKWRSDFDPAHTLPVARKIRKLRENPGIEPAQHHHLSIDFLVFNARGYDYIGTNSTLKWARDSIYSHILEPARGFRRDRSSAFPRSQYGIASHPVDLLRTEDSWVHSGDQCEINHSSSSYTRSTAKVNIPLICGISGSTNLSLWGLLNTGADLNEEQMQLFLLSIWSTHCANGGHSLQEVLSAAKLISDALTANPPPDYLQVSKPTLESLKKVTAHINPTGEGPDFENFGKYYSTFFAHIKSPGFIAARELAQKDLVHYVKAHCH